MPRPFLATQTATRTGTTVAAAAVLAVTAVALSFAGGMMAVAGGLAVAPKRVVRIAAVGGGAAPVFGSTLWQFSFEDYTGFDDPVSLADIAPLVLGVPSGLEVVGDQIGTFVDEPKNLLLLSSQGKRFARANEVAIANSQTGTPVDWDGDGQNEIVNIERGTLLLTERDGDVIISYKFATDFSVLYSSPAVTDLNGDGRKDFVVTGVYKATLDGKVVDIESVFAVSGLPAANQKGTLLWRYDLDHHHDSWVSGDECISRPMTPQLDGDRFPDVVFMGCDCVEDQEVLRDGMLNVNDPQIVDFPLTEGIGADDQIAVGEGGIIYAGQRKLCGTAVFRLGHDGSLRWRQFLSDKYNTSQHVGFDQLATADFGYGSADLEIIATPYYRVAFEDHLKPTALDSQVALLRPIGEILWQQNTYNVNLTHQGRSYLHVGAVGNMIVNTGEDTPEYVACYGDAAAGFAVKLGLFDARGQELWSQGVNNCTFAPLSVADLTGDGKLEIVMSDGSRIDVRDGRSGTTLWSYPVPDGYAVWQGGSIADIDGSGTPESVFLGSWDICNGVRGICDPRMAIALTFPQSAVGRYVAPWPMHRHDLHRTAWYEYRDPSAFPAPPKVEPQFRRGDANVDGAVDISDPIFILGSLLPGGAQPSCLDAADADDNSQIQTQDAIAALNYMFAGGPEIPSPGPTTPGPDPTADPLGCAQYP
ncbi:MAG: VCBS repeat-containing protein [bacterium]|nr:VCBS repeat-containing protein [bacterium]